MATHIPRRTSAEDAADIADQIAAALEADDDTVDLAPVWNAMVVHGDDLAARVRAAARRTGRARARLTVIDSRWDTTDSGFSRRMLDASNGKPKEPPYSTFYAKATASKINHFGVQREIAFGRDVVSILDGDPSSPITAEWRARWAADTDALEQAATDRDAAVRAEVPLDVEETLFADALNLEIDRLEGELKKRFAGQPKRVAAFLEATRRSTPKRRKQDDEDSDEA